MNQKIKQQLDRIVKSERIYSQEPLSRHTTFRIGGPADFFVCPENAEELAGVLKLCGEEEIPYFILGNGSNLLVGDRGYRGIVIQIYKNMNRIAVDGDRIYAQAGALLGTIAQTAQQNELAGLEFAAGIPGTLGGAVVMNAGAYGGEMKDVIEEVTVLTVDGEIRKFTGEEMAFGYRRSIVSQEGYIVLDAVMSLESGTAAAIRARMQELKEKRVSKQPLEYPSAGSTFKRPQGHFAGKLIMDSGLRGKQIGGAQVSEKHCGFIINRGQATSADVQALMKHVRDTVYDKYQVRLEPEVKMIGE